MNLGFIYGASIPYYPMIKAVCLLYAYIAAFSRIYKSDPPPTPASGRGFGRH